MIELAKTHRLLQSEDLRLIYEHCDNKLIIFKRGNLLFAFNFHPQQSYADYRFEAPPGTYRMLLTSDAAKYGGHDRLVSDQEHMALPANSNNESKHQLSLYLPSRTAIVLQHLI